MKLKIPSILISFLLAGSSIWSAEKVSCEMLERQSPQNCTGRFMNEDCIDFFVQPGFFQKEKAGELVDSYVDVLAGAGVSVPVCNTSSRRTNYRSKVCGSFLGWFRSQRFTPMSSLSLPLCQKSNAPVTVGRLLTCWQPTAREWTIQRA